MSTTTKQVQNVVAISATAKATIKGFTEVFSAPSKSKDDMNLTEREAVDGILQFVEKFRYTTEERFKTAVNEAGEIVETDELESYEHDWLAPEMEAVMKERMNITRVVSSSKVKALESEKEALQAQLNALLAKFQPQLSANEY